MMKVNIINLILGVLLFPLTLYSIYVTDYFWAFWNGLFCILNIGVGMNYFDKEGEKKDVR